MTITIRPLHLAIFIAFAAGILLAAGVAFGLSGGADSKPDETTAASATESPTPIPALESTATPEPTEEPEPTAKPSAEPEPTSTPEIRTCEEIRADPTYRSPQERTFFLENCTGDEPAVTTGETAAQPTPSSSSSTAATTAEKIYRDRAEGSVKVFVARLTQFDSAVAPDSTGYIYDFAAVMRRQAQEMDLLPAPPPRFKQVHDQLRASLVSLADFMITIANVDTEQEFYVWLDGYFEAFNMMFAALDDYALVVGFELPPYLAPQ